MYGNTGTDLITGAVCVTPGRFRLAGTLGIAGAVTLTAADRLAAANRLAGTNGVAGTYPCRVTRAAGVIFFPCIVDNDTVIFINENTSHPGLEELVAVNINN